jgi:hypothetical protein|tara:strand:+ start:122 stop:1171 length:1050 start_codon:yes stop_codon:yes gene_type:complete
MRNLRLACLILFFTAILPGCASFLAGQIVKGGGSQVSGNFDWTVDEPVCDNLEHCVPVTRLRQQLPDSENHSLTLKFDFYINQNHKIWFFEAPADSQQPKPLENDLIVLFAGYNQPAQILTLHQQWLHKITGAEVWVVPGAEQAERFSFGLNYVSPLVGEISRRQPKNVHLVGFSMGALAAEGVMEHIDNGRLYLIAPMTDFRLAVNSLWNSVYKNKVYTSLIGDETVEEAVDIVYQRAGKTEQDTELVRRIERLKGPAIIYASHNDKVTPAAAWTRINSDALQLKTYRQMSHPEMLALFRQDLLQDFISDLLGHTIDASDTDILGILCDGNDIECLNHLSADDNESGD